MKNGKVNGKVKKNKSELQKTIKVRQKGEY